MQRALSVWAGPEGVLSPSYWKNSAPPQGDLARRLWQFLMQVEWTHASATSGMGTIHAVFGIAEHILGTALDTRKEIIVLCAAVYDDMQL